MLYLVVFLLVLWAVTWALKYRLSYIHVTLVFLSAQLIGTYNIGTRHGEFTSALYLAFGIAMIVFGLALAQHGFARDVMPLEPTFTRTPTTDRIALAWYVVITSAFVIYHYAVGGVPLFQEDVLLTRFDNTSSGMLGVPGRFNLFGAFFLFFVLVGYAQTIINQRSLRFLLITTVALLVVSRILQGNKGALVHCMLALLVVGPHMRREYRGIGMVRRVAKGTPRWVILVGGIAAVLTFFVVARIHIQQGMGLYDNVLQALVQRVTIVSGGPFYETVTVVAPRYGLGYGKYFASDLAYFASAFGIDTGVHFSLTQLVSSSLTGRDVLGDKFLVPVAMNGLGYLYLEFGLVGITLGGVLLGYALGASYFRVAATVTPLRRAILFYVQLGLAWVVARGNFGFYVPNMLLLALVFVATLYAASLMAMLLTGRKPIYLQHLRRIRRESTPRTLGSVDAIDTTLRCAHG